MIVSEYWARCLLERIEFMVQTRRTADHLYEIQCRQFTEPSRATWVFCRPWKHSEVVARFDPR